MSGVRQCVDLYGLTSITMNKLRGLATRIREP